MSIDQVPPWLVFTVDHVTFVAVGTTALFGAAAMAGDADDARWQRADQLAAAGLVLGLAGMAVGIGAGSAVIEGAFAAALGIGLLPAVVVAGLRAATTTRRTVGRRHTR